MPRGRAGLDMIPSYEVAYVFKWGGSDYIATTEFGVAGRTLRRWIRTGLPLNYGRKPITRDEWKAAAAKLCKRYGFTWPIPAERIRELQERTRLDRHLSAHQASGQASSQARNLSAGISPDRSRSRKLVRPKPVRPAGRRRGQV